MLRKMTLGDKLKKIFGIGKATEEFYEDLEEALIEGDIGARISLEIVDELRQGASKQRLKSKEDFIGLLKEILGPYVLTHELAVEKDKVNLFLVLGVNGVGKTTSIAKLANFYREKKSIDKILLSAGDTFRAAAIDQLKLHGERLGFKVVHQEPGSDPGAVIFDSLSSAMSKDFNLVIADTAGRLHNKDNLVKELTKIHKIVSNKIDPAHYKKILVLDATTGQNAYQQAETFHKAVGIDSIILTKYDSTAKGGSVISISKNLGIPFSFMGIGEKWEDLVPFDRDNFLNSLLGVS
ncbi:MAG: signal recognition particle-docking protein FtsY [Spirochaetales bacterium]|nr:signal recognition particle-docking protein FtsY [Spirochaetales bacterium]